MRGEDRIRGPGSLARHVRGSEADAELFELGGMIAQERLRRIVERRVPGAVEHDHARGERKRGVEVVLDQQQ